MKAPVRSNTLHTKVRKLFIQFSERIFNTVPRLRETYQGKSALAEAPVSLGAPRAGRLGQKYWHPDKIEIGPRGVPIFLFHARADRSKIHNS